MMSDAALAQSNQSPQGTVVPSNQQSSGRTGQSNENPEISQTATSAEAAARGDNLNPGQTSTQARVNSASGGIPGPVIQGTVEMPARKPIAGPAPQSPGDRALAEKMFGTGRITPDRIRRNCANPIRRGEIIVCGPTDQGQRVSSTADSDPTSNQALHDGRLHTPDVAGDGIFKGKPTISHLCLPSCPKGAAYMIDLKSIPEAPAGSDADKIAKGEMRAP